jgi:hypothetical protein
MRATAVRAVELGGRAGCQGQRHVEGGGAGTPSVAVVPHRPLVGACNAYTRTEIRIHIGLTLFYTRRLKIVVCFTCAGSSTKQLFFCFLT